MTSYNGSQDTFAGIQDITRVKDAGYGKLLLLLGEECRGAFRVLRLEFVRDWRDEVLGLGDARIQIIIQEGNYAR
jgi:hypothetical protein